MQSASSSLPVVSQSLVQGKDDGEDATSDEIDATPTASTDLENERTEKRDAADAAADKNSNYMPHPTTIETEGSPDDVPPEKGDLVSTSGTFSKETETRKTVGSSDDEVDKTSLSESSTATPPVNEGGVSPGQPALVLCIHACKTILTSMTAMEADVAAETARRKG